MRAVKLRCMVTAVSGALFLGFGANALADTTDDIVQALMAKGVLTEEEGALLLKGRTGEKEAAEAKKKTAVTAKYKDGIVFESGDGDFSATLNGRVQADYRYFGNDAGKNNPAPANTGNSIANTNNVPDTFELRRARIGMKAKFKKYYEAEVAGDFTSAGATIDVAYLNVAWWKEAQFRFGIFKMPMNLEELTSSNNIDFMERSFVNALVPAKEIGLMLHGTPYKGITYALAGSNGNLKNAETDMREDGKDILGRATINIAELLDNKDMVMHLGASFSQGDLPQGTVGVNGRTEGRGVTFFTAPTLANPTFKSIDRSRYGVEGVVAYGPFKLQGEWLRANNSFSTNTRNYSLDMDNWYAEALWTITGEKYADIYKNGAFGGIKPKADFNPTNFSGGAWEVGFRFSQFDASDYNSAGIGRGVGTLDSAFTTTANTVVTNNQAKGFAQADSYTVGIKFLPTSNMRFMVNYVKSEFTDPIGGASGGVVLNNKRINSEDALIMRAQWMF